MVEQVRRTTRRERRAEAKRETIEELFGDVIGRQPSGLYDPSEVHRPAPAPEAAPATAFSSRAMEQALDDAAGDPLRGPNPLHDPNRAMPRLAPASAEAPGRIAPGSATLTEGGAHGLAEAYRDAGEGAPAGFTRHGSFDFVKKGGDLDAVVVRHGLITLLSLGLWRFWQKTAIRRSVWAHTRLGGEPFEYTGKGWELFLGALIAIAFVGGMSIALHLAFTWLGIEMGFSEALLADPRGQALALSLLVAAPMLMEYARFRARRYRLRRTRWRGLRMDMTGSAAGLALRWVVFGGLSILTLGLANPFLRVQRERYMTERTWWGKSKFQFFGSAWRLMPAWIFAWALLAAPVLSGVAVVWHAAEAEGLVPAIGDAARIEAERAQAAEAAAAEAAAAAAPAPEPEPDPLADVPVPVIAAPPPMLGGGQLEPGERAAPPPGLTLPPPVRKQTPEDMAAEAAGPGAAGPALGSAAGPGAGTLGAIAPVTVPAASAPETTAPEAPAPAGAVQKAIGALIGAPLGAALAAVADLRSDVALAVERFAAAPPAAQALGVLGWVVLTALALTAYRTAEIRMFVEGRRLLGAWATCSFGLRDAVRAGLATLGRAIWPGLPITVVIGIVTAIPIFWIDGETLVTGAGADTAEQMIDQMEDWRDQLLILSALALSYGMTALLAMWLTMAVMFRAWHTRLCRSIHVSGMETLDRASQRAKADAREAEGLADALDIDVGI